MNVDRGQTSFSVEEIQALRDRLLAYKDYEAISWAGLGKRVGRSEGTLQPWAKGNYAGDNGLIAAQVNKFFLSEESQRELELTAPIVPGFQLTKTARRIHAQLMWAHRGKMTVVVGSAGVGKTAATRQYRQDHTHVFIATMSPATRSPSAMMQEIIGAIQGMLEARNHNLQTLFHTVADRLRGIRGLLIIDEAQHLTDLALEVLRALHDEVGCGVALVGNSTVLTRIQGGARAAEFAQLFSRLSQSQSYDRPDAEDIEILLVAWEVTHPKEREFLTRLAAQPGCLRTITQVLELATLTARAEGDERKLDHLKYAWGQHARVQVSEPTGRA